MKLYHYTDLEGAEGIVYSGVIRAHTGHFGKGVYFTALSPHTDIESLALNNYDDRRRVLRRHLPKTEYYFEFDKEDLPDAKKIRDSNGRDVWIVRHDVELYDDNQQYSVNLLY